MQVTADDYVFCGNGFQANPEKIVIQRLFDARQGPQAKRSQNPQVNQPFRFWFNCSATMPNKVDQQAHMQEVVTLVNKLVSQSNGKLKAKFLGDGPTASFDLAV